MPYRRKDSSVFWVSYVLPGGNRVRRSTGTTDRKEAEALEHKWNLEVYQGKNWGTEPERTFEELMLEYLRETQPKKRAAERDIYSAKQLRKVFSGMVLQEINAEAISEYKRKRTKDGIADTTIGKELRLLSAAFNYARKEWGWEIPNPVQGRCPKEGPGRIRWITRKEANKLIAAARSSRAPWLADLIELGLNSGMRIGEMLGLEWNRVDLGQRLIYLDPKHQKNKSSGSVPINDSAKDVLMSRFRFVQKHCPGTEWVFCDWRGNQIQSVKKSFKTACEHAGIKDFRLHDLRHTCAAWLVQAGVPIRTVSEVLRHKDIKTTMRYAHLAPENLREAVSVLSESRFGHAEQNQELAGKLSH